MTVAFHSKTAAQLLSWVLLIVLLSVIVPVELHQEPATKSQQVQILNDQQVCVVGLIKVKSSFSVKACFAGVTASSPERTTSIWRSLPKGLLVSLFERNSFYAFVTINAP